MKKSINSITWNRLHLIILGLILIFSFAVRFNQIATVPTGALIDEAHFGYLAYSLLETGKDEHGVSWPLLFKGFGDYKLPMGVYVLLPFVKFLDLNNAVIRYPSVLAGTLIVLGAYLLIRAVTSSKRLALLGALITATSPWTFVLSRFGFESNLALCFLIFALWLSIRGIQNRSLINLVIAGILYGMTWYSYVAYRPFTMVFIGLLGISLAILYKKASLKLILGLTIPFILLISVFFAPQLSKSNTARFNQVGIFSDIGITLTIDESRAFCGENFSQFMCYSVWNKPSLIVEILFSRFISSLSPEYLFLNGEPPGGMFSARGFALLFPVLLPFYFVGLAGYFFVRQKTKQTEIIRLIILLGLLLAPLPAIIAGDPQRVRISSLYPFVLLTIIFGVEIVLQKITRVFIRDMVIVLLSFAILASFYRYSLEWFGVHVDKFDLRYQSYVPGLMMYLQTVSTNDNARVLIKPFFSDPLMFYAYYTKLDPRVYQSLARLGTLEESGFQHTVELGNLKVNNLTPAQAACEFSLSNDPLYYVTDEQLNFPLLYSGRATNGVHPYVNVYDLGSIQQAVICNE